MTSKVPCVTHSLKRVALAIATLVATCVPANAATTSPPPQAFTAWGAPVYDLQLGIVQRRGAYWIALRNTGDTRVNLCRYPLDPLLVVVARNGKQRAADRIPPTKDFQPGGPTLQDLDPGATLVWPAGLQFANWYRARRAGDRVLAQTDVLFLGSQASCHAIEMQSAAI